MAKEKTASRSKPKQPAKASTKKPSALARAKDEAQADKFEGVNMTAYNEVEPMVFSQLKKLESLRGEYMNACKGPRERIKALEKQYRPKGVPTQTLRDVIADKLLDAKKQKLRDEMEQPDRDLFYQVREPEKSQIGKRGARGAKALSALKPDADAEKVKNNVVALKEGITQLEPSSATEGAA